MTNIMYVVVMSILQKSVLSFRILIQLLNSHPVLPLNFLNY